MSNFILDKGVHTKRFREKFTKYQYEKLFSSFLSNNYPTTKEKRALTKELQLTIDQVQSWFVTMRTKVPKDDINATIRGKEI